MNYNNNMNELMTIFDKLFVNFEDVFEAPTVQRGGEIYHAPNFPPVNVYIDEKTKDLTFDFAIAGYKKEDISIEFDGDKMILTIKEKSSTRKGLKLLKKGIKTTEVRSHFTVPVSKYETDKAEAEINDGILAITIPARDEIKPRLLTIK